MPVSAYWSQHGMLLVASLMLSISLRTMSLRTPLGGAPRWRGGGRLTYVRLSKRQRPNLPVVRAGVQDVCRRPNWRDRILGRWPPSLAPCPQWRTARNTS